MSLARQNHRFGAGWKAGPLWHRGSGEFSDQKEEFSHRQIVNAVEIGVGANRSKYGAQCVALSSREDRGSRAKVMLHSDNLRARQTLRIDSI